MSELAIIPKGKPLDTQVTVADRLSEFNFDPVAQAVAIAKGEVLTQDHPLLPLLQSWVDDMLAAIHDQEHAFLLSEDPYENLLEMGRKFLTDSWVSHDLRYRQTKDLIEYIHGKQGQVKKEEIDDRGGETKEVKPLTRQEVELFNDVFNAAY